MAYSLAHPIIFIRFIIDESHGLVETKGQTIRLNRFCHRLSYFPSTSMLKNQTHPYIVKVFSSIFYFQ